MPPAATHCPTHEIFPQPQRRWLQLEKQLFLLFNIRYKRWKSESRSQQIQFLAAKKKVKLSKEENKL